MKTSLRKIALSLLLVIALNVVLYSAAKAVTTQQNYNGITTAQAEKTITNGTPYWDARLWSRSKSPAISMDDIGYSWWTVREKCGTTITNQVSVPAHVLHNTSLYYAANTMTKRSCDGFRYGQSLGNHDHYEYPYSHLYMYLDTSNVYIP
jgi:hypothetical protein